MCVAPVAAATEVELPGLVCASLAMSRLRRSSRACETVLNEPRPCSGWRHRHSRMFLPSLQRPPAVCGSPVRESVSGGNDSGFLDHQYGAADRDDGPVQHPGWNGERLPRPEFNRVVAVEFDAEQPVQDEEELILPVVFVPVEFALHHTEPHQDIADPDEGLVVPGVA